MGSGARIAVDGVLVVDKPPGMTSHDVVDEVRRRFRTRKVGHAGTLDPNATGVLVCGLGRATRFLSYAQDVPKRYLAHAVFGVTTSSQDASGRVIEERPVVASEHDLAALLPGFTGTVLQVPPMVSAVRHEGERLHVKARRGEEVERQARQIHVYTLGLAGWQPGRHPEATLDVGCSAGTYVRTLVHDLGAQLGCGAHLRALRRTEAGGFTLADSVPLDRIDARHLRSLVEAVRGLRRVEVDDAGREMVAHGRPLPLALIRAGQEEWEPGDEPVAVVSDGELLGVYRRRADTLAPERVVSA
ncbi:MAG: tRNA pseudouridine(55) synthase TruB [Actinomycetota bacterium]|nr:tRNA pseudouridine(55) synthase TruB [Actinomycetota bacterium]